MFELNKFNMRKILSLAITVIIVVFLLMHIEDLMHGLQRAKVVLSPFLIGTALAFVWNVPLRFLEGRIFSKIKAPKFKKFQRPLAILLSFIIIIAVVTLGALVIVPQLIESITLFINNIPEYVDKIVDFALELPDPDGRIHAIIVSLYQMSPADVQENVMNFLSKGAFAKNVTLGEGLSTAINSTFGVVSSIMGILVNTFVALFFAIYALTQKEKLARQGRKIIYAFMREPHASYTVHVCQVTFSKFYHFITGQLTEACILGVLTFIGMWIFRFPYAAMVAVLTGFSALIPIVGAIVGGGVGFLLILAQDPTKAILFIVFIIVLQQFESNVIYPRVVGGSVGLPALWTLVAITIGGTLMGLVGMLIFVPLASALYFLVGEIVNGRLAVKNIYEFSPEIVRGLPRHMEVADKDLEIDV